MNNDGSVKKKRGRPRKTLEKPVDVVSGDESMGLVNVDDEKIRPKERCM